MSKTERERQEIVAQAGYELTLDYSREVGYIKKHDDGRITQIQIEGRFEDWSVSVLDTKGKAELGGITLGAAEQKDDAKEIAVNWMQENPEGVDA